MRKSFVTRAAALSISAGLLLTLSTAAAAAEHAPRTQTVPASIASDCSADVSASLGRWLQSVPDGSTARLRRHGCYRVETEVVVRDKHDVVLDGQGALLRRTVYSPPERRYPSANAGLRLVDWVDSTVHNLRIRGTNTIPDLPYMPPYAGTYRQEVEFDHGLALHGSVRMTVAHVSIRSVWGDGVYLAGGDQWTNQWSDHVVLRDVRVVQNGRQGIAINRSRHVLVDRAYIKYSRRSAIDLEPDTAGETILDVEIRDSDLGSNLLAISSAGAGRVNQVVVHDNRVHTTGIPWVYVRSMKGLDRHDWTVRDNLVTYPLGSPMPALAFWNTHGIVVQGNRMSLATTQSQLAVALWDGSDHATVKCNVFLGARAAYVEGPAGAATLSYNRLTPGGRGCARRGRPVQPLGVPIPRLAVGATGPLVRYAERLLGLPVDGTFDQRMAVSVGTLQGRHGLATTGVLDEDSWPLLLSRRG